MSRARTTQDPVATEVAVEMLRPLSERSSPAGMQRRYSTGPDRQERIAGDEHLLTQLARVCGGHTKVAELGEQQVRSILEDVESQHLGRWHVEREPDASVIEALDAHFVPLQEGALETRRETAELLERRAAADVENAPRLTAEAEERAKRDLALWGIQT